MPQYSEEFKEQVVRKMMAPNAMSGVGVEKGDLVLDFFAGSCATGQAVLEYSSEKGNVRDIAIQLPEKIDENTRAFGEHAQFSLKFLPPILSKQVA